MMHSQWYVLNVASLPKGIVIVDATAEAGVLWETIVLSTLEELGEQLPAELQPGIVFLGDHHVHPFTEVLHALKGIAGPGNSINLQSELGRFSVIGPFFREWLRADPRPVVLMTNSPIEDLEDWGDSRFLTSLLVKRLTGSERLTRPPFHEIGYEADLQVLVKHLQDPVQEMRVGGQGVFAIDWLPVEMIWENGTLRGPGIHTPNARMLLAHPMGQLPRIELLRESGTTISLPLTPITAPPEPGPIILSVSEASVIDRWIAGRSFPCRQCLVSHPPGHLRYSGCSGKELLSSLQNHAQNTIWKLKKDGEWKALPAPQSIVLHEDEMIVNRGGDWRSYQFVDEQWVLGEPRERFIEVGEREYLFPG